MECAESQDRRVGGTDKAVAVFDLLSSRIVRARENKLPAFE